jgi:hypothetical protein
VGGKKYATVQNNDAKIGRQTGWLWCPRRLVFGPMLKSSVTNVTVFLLLLLHIRLLHYEQVSEQCSHEKRFLQQFFYGNIP